MTKLFIILSLLFTFNSFATIHCQVFRGEESIELYVHDAFVGKLATVVRTHPLVTYEHREVFVMQKENQKSVVILNEEQDFRLKIGKEFVLTADGTDYFRGDLKFEDILARMKCKLD